MRYLLDTHVLLWAVTDSPELGHEARQKIASDDHVIFLSMASLWELQIKESIGKIILPKDFFSGMSESGFEILNISVEHLQALRRLPLLHRDPFDRMLVAQARHEEAILMTRDVDVMKYDVNFLKV